MQDRCGRCLWGCVSVQASGRSWLLRTIFPQMGSRSATQSGPVLCRGTAWGWCPSPHAEGCALAALCARSGGQAARVCGRARGRVCRVLWLQRQGLCGGGGTALVLAAVATKRLPLSWPARHKWPLLEGLPAQRHRSAGLTEERSRRPEKRWHRSNTYRGVLAVLPWQGAVSL